jgi:hypothetical protein
MDCRRCQCHDGRAYDGNYGISVTIANQTGFAGAPKPAGAARCTDRYRIPQTTTITPDIQKSFLGMLLAARLSGERVRLLVDPANNWYGSCLIVQVSIGDV